MTKGINRAFYQYNVSESIEENLVKPCIFMSHKSLDKRMAIKIGEYIQEKGIDVYLDINDEMLQAATTEGDDEEITRCIQAGIAVSTHILCLISPSTVRSWWVPYEIGYGEKSEKGIATLLLKDMPDDNLPEYLTIRDRVRIDNLSKLDDFLDNVKYENVSESGITELNNNLKRMLELANRVAVYPHPLAQYVAK